jgi:hypothetical protein
MDLSEAEHLCDRLAELASAGPSKDPQAFVRTTGILRSITQSPQGTAYVRERAGDVERALRGWFDSEERFRPLLKTHSRDIYTLIERLHGALREAIRFGGPRAD